MLSRRRVVKIVSLSLISALVGGCATPQSARAPTFQWGQSVEFEGIRFDFNSARTASSFTNWLNQITIAANTFVIIDVTLVNKTGSPLPSHFQPIFRLLDSSGAIYEPDVQKTLMINMQKSGRVAYGQNMNPNTSLKQEIVFEVPKQTYVVQVIVPNHAQVGFAGEIKYSGPYFLYDISSQI